MIDHYSERMQFDVTLLCTILVALGPNTCNHGQSTAAYSSTDEQTNAELAAEIEELKMMIKDLQNSVHKLELRNGNIHVFMIFTSIS